MDCWRDFHGEAAPDESNSSSIPRLTPLLHKVFQPCITNAYWRDKQSATLSSEAKAGTSRVFLPFRQTDVQGTQALPFDPAARLGWPTRSLLGLL